MVMDLLGLARLPRRELERVFAAGEAPDIEGLVGWEFRGYNPPAFARALGIQRFVKGFFRGEAPPGEAEGYNMFASQRDWTPRTLRGHTWRHGFYLVRPARGRHAGTLELDYGASRRNAAVNPERLLRDYVVQPDPDNPHLLLGKAYLAMGALMPVSFFLLERERETSE